MGGGFHLEESGCDQIEETVLDFSTLQLPIPKTFTIQAKVTDAASTNETAAVALLTAFKTAAATMRGGLFDFAAVQQQKRQFGKTTTSSCTRLVLSHKKTELQIELLIS